MHDKQRKEDPCIQRRDWAETAKYERSTDRPEERAANPAARRKGGTHQQEYRRDERTRQSAEETDGNASFDGKRGRLPGGERNEAHAGARADAEEHEAEARSGCQAGKPVATIRAMQCMHVELRIGAPNVHVLLQHIQ